MKTDLVDSKDLMILDILKDHSDYTTRKISKMTGLPATTIHNRIKKLNDLGIIKNYTIKIDYSKIERNFVAYIMVTVDIKQLKKINISQYELAEKIRNIPAVERVDIVSGGTDLITIARVKDVEEFDKFLIQNLQQIDGVEKTQSMIVIHRT